MKNPIGKCGLFATYDNFEALQKYAENFNGQEAYIFNLALGLTVNTCSAIIDDYIEQQENYIAEEPEEK